MSDITLTAVSVSTSSRKKASRKQKTASSGIHGSAAALRPWSLLRPC